MAVTKTHLKRCDLIALEGRFDSATAPELEQALRAAMDAGTHRIVLDLSKVDYFGSAAIRVLVMAYKECRRWNRGDVRLASLPPRIRYVLDLAGILPLITVFDDAVMAVGSF
ncbi:MAG: STAS domain-containing protein [Chloroflexota bacterium]